MTLKKLNKTVENEIENKTSGFKWLPGFLGGGFFNSEWSFAQVRITSGGRSSYGAGKTIVIALLKENYNDHNNSDQHKQYT